jgi:hypothetical protein
MPMFQHQEFTRNTKNISVYRIENANDI